MSTIVTRSGKGAALTWTEVDSNFTNLNTDKYQEGSAIGAVTPAAGTFTTLTATGRVQFGTYNSLASTTFSIDGFIEIKDSTGNIRKLAVIV